MRTLIDIPDEQIRALARIGESEGVSRSALVRRAITRLLSAEVSATDDAAFGSWKGVEDGLVYQDRLRAEW